MNWWQIWFIYFTKKFKVGIQGVIDFDFPKEIVTETLPLLSHWALFHIFFNEFFERLGYGVCLSMTKVLIVGDTDQELDELEAN